jgi:hypothetical protein
MPDWLSAAIPVVAPLIGSLVAVLLLAQVARWMGLGATHERIRDEGHAIQLAEEAECGFDGVAADVDAAGYGAIVRNAAGAMMLIRAHGNRFAARRIDRGFTARLDRNRLWLASGERTFGAVELDFGARAGVIASRLREVL